MFSFLPGTESFGQHSIMECILPGRLLDLRLNLSNEHPVAMGQIDRPGI